MRIFQVLDGKVNEAIPGNLTWIRNLREPLVEMGHDVFFLPATEGKAAERSGNKKARARFSEKLVQAFRLEHRKKPFDIFFAYLEQGMVEGEAIDEIRRWGVPTCNFSCNNTHQFHLAGSLATHFDYNLHSEGDAGARFAALGAKALWWPMASNPKYFKPYPQPRTIPVSFVGANYGLRAHYVTHLLRNNIDVQCFGPTWRFAARSAFRAAAKRLLLLLRYVCAQNEERQASVSAALSAHDFNRRLWRRYSEHLHEAISDPVQLYSKSEVSLGVLEVFENNDPSEQILRHLHLREFEAPMSGALYCTGYMKELEHFYELDREILVYRSEEELLDKVRFYLTHPREADRVRQAGHRRALAEHTCQERFRRLFRELGLRGE